MYRQYRQEDSSNLWLYGRRMNSFDSQLMIDVTTHRTVRQDTCPYEYPKDTKRCQKTPRVIHKYV